jgi:hypothetical protein
MNKKNTKPTGKTRSKRIANNATGVLITLVVILIVFKFLPGYNQLVDGVLGGTWKIIQKFPGATYEKKIFFKLGNEATYMFKLRDATPEHAVILMPPDSLLKKANFVICRQKARLTYFLYPRKVVYEDEQYSNPLYDKAGYILCLNGWGFDKTDFRPEQPLLFMILPVIR